MTSTFCLLPAPSAPSAVSLQKCMRQIHPAMSSSIRTVPSPVRWAASDPAIHSPGFQTVPATDVSYGSFPSPGITVFQFPMLVQKGPAHSATAGPGRNHLNPLTGTALLLAIMQVSMTGRCGLASCGYSHHYKLIKVFSSMNSKAEIPGNVHSFSLLV